jgi:hypothetical protein
MSRLQPLAEVLLIFAIFFIDGAAPVPEVNEPYYLGKAIHYWNPEWAKNDFFLGTADTHQVFYFTFGWLSLWLDPTALAWTGRILTWTLLAWSWQRLSFAVLPRRWFAILSAALLVMLIKNFHLAGEWLIGGVEAKGFAYVLVFLGLEAVVRSRWNRAWLLLGAASAFHVLVGGWSAVAAGLVWLVRCKDCPSLRAMLPGLVGGFLLSLLSLWPALTLNRGTDSAVIREANRIYVFERLTHHLSPADIRINFTIRFMALSVFFFWLAWRWSARADDALRPAPPSGEATHDSQRLGAFVAATLAIAAVGWAISLTADYDVFLAAGLLRFYWFRLADIAVPLGVALFAAALIARELRRRPVVGRSWLAVAVLAAGWNLGDEAVRRLRPTVPPSDSKLAPESLGEAEAAQRFLAWREICREIAESDEIPPGAVFLTPRMNQTFKWYSGRAEVANWKEIPQDAQAMVDWWQRLADLYAEDPDNPFARGWLPSLTDLEPALLKELGRKYKARFVLTEAAPPRELPVVLQNEYYVVYELDDAE